MKRQIACGLAALPLLALPGVPAAFADSAGITFSNGRTFTEQTGEQLFTHVCAACHLDQGQGAVGAGHYPALANNANLESAGYPILILLQGQKGMPPVGQMMSDDQIAAVVNYVRTHFGNNYQDAVTAEDVKASR
ncbi:cytochrome c [Mesorhizobium sp. BAC0120]|uniref:c-type cytochrome n=1 Tax=Mesorhizobium sp. BAC0120 TaxID=3090670 RepID=UPI00298CD1FD|nr:cytochrome c [Mesorhizobium sp. BAC0120]MDW6024659.1 cytochrome c [Mesorhizobium sp. BAC0120]